MHSFEVHSNESACGKMVRLGLEQVIHRRKEWTKTLNYHQYLEEITDCTKRAMEGM